MPQGPPLRVGRDLRAPLDGDDVTQVRTGVVLGGVEYHCKGSIVDRGDPGPQRFEFVLHGPDAPYDERCVGSWFPDLDAATRAAPRLAAAWVAFYVEGDAGELAEALA